MVIRRPVPKDFAMPDIVSSRGLSRRGLLAAAGAAGLGALLAGCGKDGGDAATSAAPTGGPWSFTDDRQQKVDAAARPSRIVAFTGVAAALVDFGLDKQIV